MTVLSELRMRPAMAEHAGWDASVRTRLVLSAVVLTLLLIGANLATPLYPLLQVQLGLTSLDITVAFAAYVFSLVAGLLLVGHWSDHIGRRAALCVAIVIALAGGLVFGYANSLAMLIAGRALQGAAVALATGASAAALRELLPRHPEWASRFTLLVSAGGVAAGPAIGGVLSTLPDPERTPFMIHTAALVALLIPLLVLKARPAIKPASGQAAAALKPRRPSISRDARGAFWMASLVGFTSFAVFGFFLSLAPTYFAQIAGTDSRPVVGLLAALVLGSSAVSQLLAMRGRYLVPAGLAGMGISVLLVAAAGWTGSIVLLIAASVAAGLCQGAAFRVVFNEVANRIEAGRHAQIISTIYVITYLGSALPVIGLGAAAGAWGLSTSVSWFAGAIALMCLALAWVGLRKAKAPSSA
ncbi:MFS transporter [Arthrobacter castelli]|uniref:MFS transporter n=1 Tax=Arthrobacter castelli TaxID=271431 RepID=UPI00042A7C30|nr:MFS transporter [Arthrobacter castelli]